MTVPQPPTDAEIAARLGPLFQASPYVRDLGIRLVEAAPGRVTTELPLAERHCQHSGYVHGGVQAALADQSAGAAAATLAGTDRVVLSIEFKISLMSPARGDRLICRAEVLKAGRKVSFAEAKVYSVTAGTERLVSHATVSLALVAAG